MKKLSLFFLLFLLPLLAHAHAHDFEATNADGVTIYYKYNTTSSTEVTVTYRGSSHTEYSNEYTGAVNIPSTVTYNGTTYSVTSIGDDAFYGCSGLTLVTIPNSVTSIGGYAFSYCRGLTSVTIPNSVTSIGDGAFLGCSGLTAFYGKFASQDNRCLIVDGVLNSFAPAGLTTYTIPNSVTSIGYGAFENCRGLTEVTIPNSVTSIGDSAFYCCSGLTEVTIPNSVTSIGGYAFSYCSGLTSVTIPNSVTSIGDSAFYCCSGLTEVTIPNSVTKIGWEAFSGCSGLTEVTIPNSVTSIGNYAFRDCSGLTEVTIPNSVTKIGDSAFFKCSGLTSVKVCNPLPENISLGSNVFYNVPTSTCTLYVPKGSRELYAAKSPWSSFENIVEFEDEEENPDEPNNPDAPSVDNYLHGSDVSVFKNKEIVVSVEMVNKVEITAFQCDIVVPEGLAIVMDEDEYDISLGSRAHRSHDLSTAQMGDGAVRLLCYSMKLSAFSGNDGEIFAIPFSPASVPGSYELKITNIELTGTDKNIYRPADTTITVEVMAYPLGDANGDGTISVSDVVEIASMILNQSSTNAPAKAPARAEDSGSLYIDSFTITAGETMDVEIKIDTPDYDITAFQVDIAMPEGLTIEEDGGEYIFDITDRAPKRSGHQAQSNTLSTGIIRVLCYSSKSVNFNDREGAVLVFPAIAATDFKGGDIELTNIEVVEKDGSKHRLAPVTVKVSETSGVELISSDNAEAVYYNLNGARVANPDRGIFIKVTGNKAEKVYIK